MLSSWKSWILWVLVFSGIMVMPLVPAVLMIMGE